MQFLISLAAWLPLQNGMFYRAERLALSLNHDLKRVFNEKGYDYVAVSKKSKRHQSKLKRDTCQLHRRGPSYEQKPMQPVAQAGGQNGGWGRRFGVKRQRALKGADLYVVRCTKTGLACAQPCFRW